MDGKEESFDVYFDLSSSPLVNVDHLFETDKTFYSRRDLETYVRDIGKKNNIGISVISSKGGEGKGLGDAVVYFACERSLNYRRHEDKESASQVKKRNSGTKRCKCPFRLKGKEICAGTWRLFVINGNHNHNFPTYNVGRSIMSRLSEDEKVKAKEMTRAHVPPSQIMIAIRNENKDNLTTMKQMYNYRQKIRKEEMEGRSVARQLLSYLSKESYFYTYRASPTDNVVTDLFFANKKAVQLLRHFYYVLIMDCTYKTNRYKMPLLEIVGIVPTGKNFVYAQTEVDYEKNVLHFQKTYAKLPNLLMYVQNTWLIHAIKFVHAYTNKVLHFGNCTTNRVESAHNALKRFLKTSTGSLDTIWLKVHSFLELQENEIKASFVRSANKDLHITVLHLLTQLTGKISHVAIKKIIKEYGRHGVDTDPATCGCYLRTSHGLPCAHEMRLLDKEEKGIELNNIHVFWRTLHMEGYTYVSDDRHIEFQDDDEILWHYFGIMMKQSSEVKKMYISQLENIIHPKAVTLEEPFSDRKSKGRPTSRSSTKRDPSYFEYVDKKTFTHKSGNKRKDPEREEFISSEIPQFVVPYIHEYINVSADGNCGYRSVAHQIYGSENQWRRVRTDLHDFIERRLAYWLKVWHKSIDEARTTLRKVHYCESPCPMEYWMSMDEMGPVIASMYNVILVALDPIQMGNLSYLPLYVQEGLISPEKLICVAFLRKYNHFISVSLIDNCPIPVIYGFWFRFCEYYVRGWDAPLKTRIDKWKSICD